jgi:FkbM family methyltransferase
MKLNYLKVLASHLPIQWQHELKRVHFRRQIRRGSFVTADPEFLMLDQLISEGDWVIDVGANIGHYTKRLSDLVGPSGRVLAFEPVPNTFSLLSENVTLFRYSNVSLLNLAASDRTTSVGISIPTFETGLKNYYQASIDEQASGLQVVTIAVDSLSLRKRIRLIKIDAEGHDYTVLRGAEQVLVRDHPILIVETNAPEVRQMLTGLGYRNESIAGSPNALYR